LSLNAVLLLVMSAGEWLKKCSAWVGDPVRAVPVLAGILGLWTVFAAPALGKVPDEASHFWRAVGIAQGHIVAERLDNELGGHIPRSLQKLVAPLLHTKLRFEDTVWQRFDGATVYSPVAYLPQVAGVIAGRILDLPPFGLFYLVRLCNLAAWLALLYTALRVAPRWGWALGAIALLPISIFQSGTATADVMTIGLMLVYVAQLIRAITRAEPMSTREFGWLAATGLLVGLTKPPLVILVLGVLAIPWRRWAGLGARLRGWQTGAVRAGAIAALIVPALVVAVAWNLAVRQVNVTQGYVLANPEQQLQLLVHQPWKLAEAMWGLHVADAEKVAGLMASFTTAAGWLGVPTLMWGVLISFGLLALVVLERAEPKAILAGRWARLVFGGIAVGLVVGMEAILYLYFTAVGAPVVNGMQGRYFIPLVLLLPLIFKGRHLYVQVSRPLLGSIVLVGSLLAFVGFGTQLLKGYPLHLDYFSRPCVEHCQ
jgi:uncharacterized membrane protein